MPWYCAKSIELYKYADDDKKFPLLFDENLYLIEAANLAEANGRVVSFAEEMAAIWTSPTYIGGLKGLVVAAGLRDIELLQFSEPEPLTVVSRSLYEPSEPEQISSFVEQAEALCLTYLGQYGLLEFATDFISSGSNGLSDSVASAELWWQSAHLVYSLTANGFVPLILEEVVIFEFLSDDWSEAEAFGRARGECSSAVFNGVEYQVHFEGIRQVNLITDARVGVGPAAFAEISYSKFELASPHQLERLLDNQNCLVKLLPASFCNLKVPDSA